MTRLTWKFSLPVLFAALALCAQGVSAGPYASLAAQVHADGGRLQVYANAALQNGSANAQVAVALDICHKIALEGVAVTTVDIIGSDGQTVLLIVDQTRLQGC